MSSNQLKIFTEHSVSVPEDLISELKRSLSLADLREQSNDRELIYFQVDMFSGLKVEVFSNEHPPPHFRVKCQNSTANFSIKDCELLNGSGEILKYQRQIKGWWENKKPTLIQLWNERRPSGCPVGVYKE